MALSRLRWTVESVYVQGSFVRRALFGSTCKNFYGWYRENSYNHSHHDNKSPPPPVFPSLSHFYLPRVIASFLLKSTSLCTVSWSLCVLLSPVSLWLISVITSLVTWCSFFSDQIRWLQGDHQNTCLARCSANSNMSRLRDAVGSNPDHRNKARHINVPPPPPPDFTVHE